MQLIVTCDSSLVAGYVLSGDLNPDSEEGVTNEATDKYSCGDKVRIKQRRAIGVILI